jgi:hypothetical protein
MQDALARDVANNHVADVGNGRGLNVERLGASAALDKRDNRALASRTSATAFEVRTALALL